MKSNAQASGLDQRTSDTTDSLNTVWTARFSGARRTAIACSFLILLPLGQQLHAAEKADGEWVAVNTNIGAMPSTVTPAAPAMPVAPVAEIVKVAQVAQVSPTVRKALAEPIRVNAPIATKTNWDASNGCATGCDDLVARVKRPSALIALYAGLGVVQGLDLYSTSKALKYGAREANPLMQNIVGNRGASIAMKAGTSAAMIYFAERLRKKSPAAAITMMAVMNGVTAAVAMHNFKNAQMLAGQR